MNPFDQLNARFSQKRLQQFMAQQQMPQVGSGGMQMPTMPQPQAPSGGVGGFVRSAVQGMIDPFEYLGKAAIVNPTRELAADITGNKEAKKNAVKASNKNLGIGDNADDFVGGLKKWAGNSAQAVLGAKVPNPATFKGAAALGAANSGAYALTDRDSDLVDVLTAGVTGAGLGAGFKGVGKLANKATTKLGGAMEGQADKYATKQLGLQGGFIGKFKDKLKEDPGQVMRRFGISSIADIDDNITQQNEMFGKLIKNTGNVDKSKLLKNIEAEAQELISAGPGPLKRRGEMLMKEAEQLLQDYDDKIPGDVLNKVKSHYDKLAGWDLAQKDPDMFEVSDIMANALRSTIQETSGNPQLKVTGKELQKLKWLRKEAVARQGTVQSRGASPFNARNLLAAAIGGGIGGVPVALAAGGATALANSTPGRRAIAGGVQKVTQGLQKDGSAIGGAMLNRAVPGAANYMAGNATPTATAQGLDDVFMDQSMPNQSQSNVMPMGTTSNNMMNSNMGGSSLNMGNNPLSGVYNNSQPQASPYSRENLMADIQRDPQNADYYIDFYTKLDGIFNQSQQAEGGFSQTTSDRLASVTNADNTISQLEDLFTTAGGGSGRVGGFINKQKSRIGWDDQTQIYNDLAQSSVTQIAKALNGGGQVSDADAAVIVQALPRVTDSPAAARAKFEALRARLMNAQQNTMVYGGGGGLEDVFSQGSMY